MFASLSLFADQRFSCSAVTNDVYKVESELQYGMKVVAASDVIVGKRGKCKWVADDAQCERPTHEPRSVHVRK